MKSLLMLFVSMSLMVSLPASAADSKVAVLDMELLNLTMALKDPQKNAEIAENDQRNVALTESLGREGFAKREQYQLVKISDAAHAEADESVGFLFDRPEAAASLGEQFDADYIVVGRYHKPTYLFSYIMLRVVDVDSGELVEEFKTEVKGRPQETIPRNIENVMVEIDNRLSQRG
jgi:hypothetical protein